MRNKMNGDHRSKLKKRKQAAQQTIKDASESIRNKRRDAQEQKQVEEALNRKTRESVTTPKSKQKYY